MDDTELDAIEQAHERFDDPPYAYCSDCGQNWPCLDRRLAAALRGERERASQPLLDFTTLDAARKKYLKLGREIEAMPSSLDRDNALHSHSKLGIFLTEVLGDDWQWPRWLKQETAHG